MPLVFNSLGADTHTHTDVRVNKISKNQARAGHTPGLKILLTSGILLSTNNNASTIGSVTYKNRK